MTSKPGRFDAADDMPIDAGSQPRPFKEVPEYFSQPLAEQTERLLSKVQRSKSDRQEDVFRFSTSSTHTMLPEEGFQTLTRLREGVYTELCDRLKARGVSSTLFSEKNFDFCLPKK
jgi:hypothetical protein